MREWRWIGAALAGFAGQVEAQQAAPPPPPADDAIVVTGERGKGSPEQRFVAAIAAPSNNGQLARFTDKVCPRSFGLGGENDEALARRIRKVAAAAHVPVADADCRPNLVVLFVQDRRQAIARWRVDRPDFFAGLAPSRIAALAGGGDPVASWQIVRVMGKDGRPIGKADSDMYDYMVNEQTVPSRLVSSIQIEFSASFVLIEQKTIGNASLTQIADYAAMRTLANTDAKAAAAQRLPTILSLFSNDGEPVPLSVTQWDLAYLTALYDSPLAVRASMQKRAMGKQMTRDRDEESAGSDRR